MKKIEYWEADDGERFETKQECYEYEHRNDIIMDEIIFFKTEKEKMKVTNGTLYKALNECYGVYVPNEGAAERLHNAFMTNGIESPYGDLRGIVKEPFRKGFFYFDDIWRCLDDEITELIEKRETMKHTAGLI